MNKDLTKPYDHISNETKIYKKWEKSGFFNPDNLKNNKNGYFSIIMPPPNANGSLHVGHAVMVAVEDLLTRYWRLKGKKALCLPGADHAGFETQVVFEKKLEKEGTSRFEIMKEDGGKNKLYNMIFKFTQENKNHMENQVKKLGASCDWSRKKFTLDNNIIKIVYKTFKRLYDDGLIYRNKRIVNWCVKHRTSLSELEVSWKKENTSLYYVKYKFADNKDKYIEIATVRPETIPGDTAVAINPNDVRYNKYIGKKVLNPITNKELSIIADKAVDMKFGTGALKVTPANDVLDFEIGSKNNLDIINTLNLDGKFNKFAGPLNEMKVPQAREEAIKILKEKNALNKTKPYEHSVGVCYKCKTTLEPMVLDQWFLDLTNKGKNSIVKPAIDAVKKGKIKIIPTFQKKVFYHWMNNIHDWNISRQIAWGIEIPAWYCDDCNNIIVKDNNNRPKECNKCGNKKLRKETDVFDTWFSSGQWVFATLKTQKKSSDIKNFYPTDVMETGYDILFFWVARMIMLSIYEMGEIPFKNVYLHGLVRDKDKKKMSKSKGNVVDPLGVVEQYGADALRMALIVGNSAGMDVIYDENKIRGYRNFSNKLWNIARFIISNNEKNGFKNTKNIETKLTKNDKKILKNFMEIKEKISKNIEKFNFSQAGETIYHYIWHTMADKIIESKKEILKNDNKSKEKTSAIAILNILLRESLITLHPFMPFVTEAIYQRIPYKNKEFLMIEKWD